MQVARFLRADTGSQLVEFALTVPLLAVFVVGIFDFGNAFTVKQKIGDAARDGARIGANLPSGVGTSFSAGGPILTADIIRDAVANSLTTSRLNSCGLSGASGTQQGTALTWVYMASGNGCSGTLVLTVNRAFPVAASVSGSTVKVLSTQVQLSYPYRWQFNKVITLVAPGATYRGITQISATVTVPNLD